MVILTSRNNKHVEYIDVMMFNLFVTFDLVSITGWDI